MKTFVLSGTALGLLLVASCGGSEQYGQPFKGFPGLELAKLVEQPADQVRKEVRIEGVVSRQCPATGCWFYLKDPQGKEVKVEMGDTIPKLPPRTGRTAAVEGQLIKYGDRYEFIGTSVEFK